MTDSLYDFDKVLQRALGTVKKKTSLSAAKKQLILEYADEMLANGLSKGRAARFAYYLAKLGEWLPCEFDEADIPVMKRLVARIEASEYVPFSKMEHKLALRKFYKWLRGTEEYPPEVKWIPMHVKASERMKLPEQLLTETDVRALIDAASCARDRAFVSLLYETGARISELALLHLKHVQFDPYGARLLVRGKTGARSVRVISSVPLLTAWINEHPRKGDPEAFLWPTNRGQPPRYSTITSLLERLAKQAGVTKPVNPHTFRHSRATQLASHLTESQMKVHFGWARASRMAAIYVHLSGRDVDDALLKLHGVKKETEDTAGSPLSPKRCQRCKTENPCANRFCSLCGLPLDPEATTELLGKDMERQQADDVLDRMLEDPAFKDQFLRRLNRVLKKGSQKKPMVTSRSE